MFLRAAFDAGTAQGFVPPFLGLVTDGIEIGVANFMLEILQRLFRADERGGDLAPDDLVAARVKLHKRARLLAGEMRQTRLNAG